MKNEFQKGAQKSLITVRFPDTAEKARARALAQQLGLPLAGRSEALSALVLEYTEQGLQLRDTRPGAPGPLRVELLDTAARRRLGSAGGQSELLGRAVGARHGRRPYVVDATAGFGGDAAMLAAIGCRVTLIEREPVVGALLRDGLRRSAEDPAGRTLTQRMNLVEADACEWLAALPETERPDVIYLDPMYPELGATARARKGMQYLQALLGPATDAGRLLQVARGVARERVVVKRPRRAPPLGGLPPSHSIVGRSTRFDVYMLVGGADR